MPSWSEILNEVNSSKDQVKYLEEKRKKLLYDIHIKTGRNIISYYSGWLKGVNTEHVSINDNDTNAFMQAIYRMDRSKGLDVVLHTPGGDIAATESIIDYLHFAFGEDIRAIIPQMAMSAGTMIALSCKSIMMGKQSSLGPIDPPFGGIACGAVLAEFEKAKEDVRNDPSCLGLWQVIIAKYHPTFLEACANAQTWSIELAKKWIKEGPKKNGLIEAFTSHTDSKSHNRHISKEKCKQLGLEIEDMEEDQELQDLPLTLHHCYMSYFDKSNVVKAVENHLGARYLRIFNSPTQVS
jgi:ClpP class serine protease